MTYDINKNASMKQNISKEEIGETEADIYDYDEFTPTPFDLEPDETVLMKCDRCGYEEEVPLWVLEELAEADGDSELRCDCMKCSKGTMRKK